MKSILEQFRNPDKNHRPRLRYWWPGGYVAHNLEALEDEMKAIAKAGFGGVEIADVYDALPAEDATVLVPEVYGFTSENWKKSVKHALKMGKKYDLQVDLTVSPHWPATTNEANPNDEGTAKELVYGTFSFEEKVPAGTNIVDLCPPHYKTSEIQIDGSAIDNKLVAVYIAEHKGHKEILMPPPVPWENEYTVISDSIAFKSLKDITDLVDDGKLTTDLTLSDGKGILIALYQRGTGQRSNMFSMGDPNRPDIMVPYAYVVDHFSKKGAALIVSLWEKNFLKDMEFRNLVSKVTDSFFEDSLELKSVGHWTDDMLVEFQHRKGYDIKPYLPFVLGINQDSGLTVSSSSFQVEAEYNDQIEVYRHDYFEVLNELYRDYHIGVLQEWVHRLGVKFRAQPYGWAIDSAASASKLDIIEGESLGFGEDGNDAFRMLAAGRDFAGLEVLSDEAGAYLFQGYATTIPQLLNTLQKNALAGVNQTFWHGTPYKYAPNAKWPGNSAFNPMLGGRGFAEAWGERQPVWEDLVPYTTYLARYSSILRYGKNVVDVLVYANGHNASEQKQVAVGDSLTRLGYNYQIMTEGLLDIPVKCENGRLTVAGASYGLIFIPEDVELSSQVKDKLNKWEKQDATIVYGCLDKVKSILGSSAFEQDHASVWTAHRKGDGHEFVVLYNLGTEAFSLEKFVSKYGLRLWNAWTGEQSDILPSVLNSLELLIFEIISDDAKKNRYIVPATEKISLKEQAWNLEVEAWTMSAPDVIESTKTVYKTHLERLQAWTELEGWEHRSGIGIYRTTFDGDKAKQLVIPFVNSTVSVKVNGKVLQGNRLIGNFQIPTGLLKEADNNLEITVATTLNNYLNDCPLTDYYGTYEQQVYGLTDVELWN